MPTYSQLERVNLHMLNEQADAFPFERVASEIHPEDWIAVHLECVLEDTYSWSFHD